MSSATKTLWFRRKLLAGQTWQLFRLPADVVKDAGPAAQVSFQRFQLATPPRPALRQQRLMLAVVQIS